jgi:nitrogen-specific signal transduction histidine kinase
LHIVYNIVTQTLKGSIHVESAPGSTHFRMRFPVSMPALEEEAA